MSLVGSLFVRRSSMAGPGSVAVAGGRSGISRSVSPPCGSFRALHVGLVANRQAARRRVRGDGPASCWPKTSPRFCGYDGPGTPNSHLAQRSGGILFLTEHGLFAIS